MVFEWLTVPARQAIADAQEMARAADRPAVGAGDLFTGLLHTATAVGGDVLRARVDMQTAEVAIRALPETAADHVDVLRMVMTAAVGAAAARGTREVGSASLLLALLALDPPDLNLLLVAVEVDAAELLAAAREADDSPEQDHAVGESEWVVTINGTETVAWDDRAE
jgi:hypothetical protein